MFVNFRYEPATDTVRTVPENYWIATVKDNKIVFDSWDAAIKGKVCRLLIRILWSFKLITATNGLTPYQIELLKRNQHELQLRS